jgi:hypothetical protein
MAVSSADLVVQDAASRIGLTDSAILDRLRNNMRDEFVIEDWQLLEMDSSQWKDLGVPIGLAAAIRNSIRELQAVQANNETINETPSSAFPSMLRSKSSVSNITAQRESAVRETFSSVSNGNLATPEDGNLEELESDENLKKLPPRSLWEVFNAHKNCNLSLRPFPLTERFHAAIFHSKSGEELKAHTMFLMELFVVISALLSGAVLEMWGSFPQDYVADGVADGSESYVPRDMAFTFHSLSYICLLVQVLGTFMWIFTLIVAAAVSADNFHKFLHQIRYVFTWYFFFTQVGAVSFMLNVGVLYGAMIWATSTGPLTRFLLGSLLPAIICIPTIFVFFNLTSYVARVAYHGLLLPHTDGLETLSAREPISNNENLTHKKEEESLCQSYYRNCVTDEEDVLEYCLQTNQRHSTKHKRRRLSAPTARKHYFAQEYTVPKFQVVGATSEIQ